MYIERERERCLYHSIGVQHMYSGAMAMAPKDITQMREATVLADRQIIIIIIILLLLIIIIISILIIIQ